MVLTFTAFALPCFGVPESPSLGLKIETCTIGKAGVRAECGRFGVYEDRQAHSGRIIELNWILLRAAQARKGTIAFLAGGPGQSAAAFAPLVADRKFGLALSELRSNYDLLFVDNRGMGDSNPFACDFAPANEPSKYFLQLWPVALVAACRTASSLTHNLAQYNALNAVDDLDDLRSELHVGKLVLYGGSGGTFFSFVFMRRHPASVESAVMTGVASPGFQPLPGAPDAAQRALNDLISDCDKDAVCHAHFPKFEEHFYAVLARFNHGLVSIQVKRLGSPDVTVSLSKEVLVDELRQVLDDPNNAAYIPYIIEKAYNGDYGPLAVMVEAVSLGLSART